MLIFPSLTNDYDSLLVLRQLELKANLQGHGCNAALRSGSENVKHVTVTKDFKASFEIKVFKIVLK